MKKLPTASVQLSLISKTNAPPGSPKNTAMTEAEQRRDCAVLCATKLTKNYWNAKAADPLGFAEAVEDMFSRFPVEVQKQALRELPTLYPTWLPQAGEVFQVCERIAAEEFRRQRRETQIKEQIEARRADEALCLPYLQPKAIAGPPVAPPPEPPRKPSDEEHNARSEQGKAIWAEWHAGKIDDAEAQRRFEASNLPNSGRNENQPRPAGRRATTPRLQT
jgi:hypothetical protein